MADEKQDKKREARIIRVRCPRCGIISRKPSTQQYYECGCGEKRVEVKEFKNPEFAPLSWE